MPVPHVRFSCRLSRSSHKGGKYLFDVLPGNGAYFSEKDLKHKSFRLVSGYGYKSAYYSSAAVIIGGYVVVPGYSVDHGISAGQICLPGLKADQFFIHPLFQSHAGESLKITRHRINP